MDWLRWLARGQSEIACSNDGAAASERVFEVLVGRHKAALERLCYFRERDPVKRQDLWQDMLLALWKSLPGYRAEGSEKAWVLRIAHNVAASHVARAVRQRHSEATVESGLAPGSPDRRLEASELWHRLRRMDVASQQLVLLHVEGLTSTEIAEATGLSVSNVTTRLSRIRKRLAAQEAEA